MQILYDHQIYKSQKYGGISRYFNELMKSESFFSEKISEDLVPNAPTPTLFKRGINFVKKQVFQNTDKKKKQYFKVIELLKNTQYDVFHPTYYDPYFVNYINKPFVLTVHDMLHEIYPEIFFDFDSISRKKAILCNKAKLIITVSENTKYDLVNILDINADKVIVTKLATNFYELKKNIPPGWLIDSYQYILFCGGRGGYKNFLFFIQSIKNLLLENKQINIVCTGNPFSKQELVFFKDLGIEKQLVFTPVTSDNELAWLYSNALCFVFPSLYEGFGFPLLEAFASDCPVACSIGGSLKEIGGKAPLFFNPKNYKEIELQVSTLIYNSEARMKAIELGREELKKYSWQKCRAETALVYKQALQVN